MLSIISISATNLGFGHLVVFAADCCCRSLPVIKRSFSISITSGLNDPLLLRFGFVFIVYLQCFWCGDEPHKDSEVMSELVSMLMLSTTAMIR